MHTHPLLLAPVRHACGSAMFKFKANFNGDLSKWNTGRVTNME